MTQSVRDHEETLGEFLASRARRASDSRLALTAIAAVLAGISVAAARGPLWDVRISGVLCLFAFGLWGLADRDLARSTAPSRPVSLLLRITRTVSATVGFAAAAYLMMALLGRALGRIIS